MMKGGEKQEGRQKSHKQKACAGKSKEVREKTQEESHQIQDAR